MSILRQRLVKLLFLTGILLLASYVLFFHRLADRDLWSSHEARAAQNAQTLLRENRWGVPHLFDKTPELQKPPLFYWLVALAAQWREQPVDAWAVRLPATMAGLAGVLGVFVFMASRGRALAGLVAAVTLATAVHYTWLARVGRIDMPLTLCVAVSLICFYLAHRQSVEETLVEAWRPLLAYLLRFTAYLAIAVAVFLKGPIGAVLPAVVWITYLLSRRENRRLKTILRSSWWWGVPLVLALAVPWFLWLNNETGGKFLERFFLYDNLERAFGADERLQSYPIWFYLPRLLLDFLPWSPVLLVAVWHFYRYRPTDEEAKFGLIWLLGVMVVLSLVRFKRADYLLPAYPGAAIFLGCFAERVYGASRSATRWALGFTLVAIATTASWWVYLDRILPLQEEYREQRRFAAAIRRLAPAPRFVVFFRAESHLLAFHLGRRLDTVLEWENLNKKAGKPGTHYIVMPPDCAAAWPRYISSGKLVEVMRNTSLSAGGHEKPLVLMCIDNADPAE